MTLLYTSFRDHGRRGKGENKNSSKNVAGTFSVDDSFETHFCATQKMSQVNGTKYLHSASLNNAEFKCVVETS
jgi:hypothetical protein